jgi:hypothetical protein
MNEPGYTMNGVATPADMSDAEFTALVVAKQGVASDLANAFTERDLETESDAYFGALGPYFVEQLVVQAAPGSVLAERLALYVAAHPVVEVVTAEQEAAAVQAVSNVAAVPATDAVKAPVTPIEPKIVAVQDAVAPVPFPASGPAIHAQPAIVTVQTTEGWFTHEGATIHDAIVKAMHWIEAELAKL